MSKSLFQNGAVRSALPLLATLIIGAGGLTAPAQAQTTKLNVAYTSTTTNFSIAWLAKLEGIWTEPAGGTTLAATMKLIAQGRIPRDESIVVSITGNGLKTQEAVINELPPPRVIEAKIGEFDALLVENEAKATAKAAATRVEASPASVI